MSSCSMCCFGGKAESSDVLWSRAEWWMNGKWFFCTSLKTGWKPWRCVDQDALVFFTALWSLDHPQKGLCAHPKQNWRSSIVCQVSGWFGSNLVKGTSTSFALASLDHCPPPQLRPTSWIGLHNAHAYVGYQWSGLAHLCMSSGLGQIGRPLG